ncbi:MAG: hypothetical protein JWQ30_200 [Sediminibacterium sp.]|nr:hypothetical protein [Sediminibacterium sp.]
MKKILFSILPIFCLFLSCSKKDDGPRENKILMLKVDYLTNTFEGGKETIYPTSPLTFTLSPQYKEPADFGNLKIQYKELNEILFDGDIIWMGTGRIKTPQNMLPASQFEKVTAADIVNPMVGFQNIFNPYNGVFDYTPIWLSIQRLVKVREYLNANPNAEIKLFLYTPSLGGGDSAEWDWIIFIKN